MSLRPFAEDAARLISILETHRASGQFSGDWHGAGLAFFNASRMLILDAMRRIAGVQLLHYAVQAPESGVDVSNLVEQQRDHSAQIAEIQVEHDFEKTSAEIGILRPFLDSQSRLLQEVWSHLHSGSALVVEGRLAVAHVDEIGGAEGFLKYVMNNQLRGCSDLATRCRHFADDLGDTEVRAATRTYLAQWSEKNGPDKIRAWATNAVVLAILAELNEADQIDWFLQWVEEGVEADRKRARFEAVHALRKLDLLDWRIYVGQDDAVETAYANLQTPISALKGQGGVGKTALAIRLVRMMIDQERFDRYVFVTSKGAQGEFNVSGSGSQILPVGDSRTAGEYCEDFKQLAGKLAAAGLVDYDDTQFVDELELAERTGRSLAATNTLLIIDNFEDVEYDRVKSLSYLAMLRAFRLARPASARILITTRGDLTALEELGVVQSVPLLKREDAWKLLKERTEWAVRRKIVEQKALFDVDVSKKEEFFQALTIKSHGEELSDQSLGHPLLIMLLALELPLEETFRSVVQRHLGDGGAIERLSDYCNDKVLALMFEPRKRDIVVVASVYEPPESFGERDLRDLLVHAGKPELGELVPSVLDTLVRLQYVYEVEADAVNTVYVWSFMPQQWCSTHARTSQDESWSRAQAEWSRRSIVPVLAGTEPVSTATLRTWIGEFVAQASSPPTVGDDSAPNPEMLLDRIEPLDGHSGLHTEELLALESSLAEYAVRIGAIAPNLRPRGRKEASQVSRATRLRIRLLRIVADKYKRIRLNHLWLRHALTAGRLAPEEERHEILSELLKRTLGVLKHPRVSPVQKRLVGRELIALLESYVRLARPHSPVLELRPHDMERFVTLYADFVEGREGDSARLKCGAAWCALRRAEVDHAPEWIQVAEARALDAGLVDGALASLYRTRLVNYQALVASGGPTRIFSFKEARAILAEHGYLPIGTRIRLLLREAASDAWFAYMKPTFDADALIRATENRTTDLSDLQLQFSPARDYRINVYDVVDRVLEPDSRYVIRVRVSKPGGPWCDAVLE